MAIDPRNYDLDELRAASGAPRAVDPDADEDEDGAVADDRNAWPGEWHDGLPGGRCGRDGTERPAADAAFEASVTRDVVALDRAADDLERPYLPALPASMAAEALLLEWLEFLLLQAGRESVADALAFYESIGWLGADAADALAAYLSGLDDRRANADNDLDADDHRVSLHYVARLASIGGRRRE
jgi:archaellum component FlaD/FlaE